MMMMMMMMIMFQMLLIRRRSSTSTHSDTLSTVTYQSDTLLVTCIVAQRNALHKSCTNNNR